MAPNKSSAFIDDLGDQPGRIKAVLHDFSALTCKQHALRTVSKFVHIRQYTHTQFKTAMAREVLRAMPASTTSF